MNNLNEQYGSFVPKTNLNNLYSLVIPHSGHTLADALKDLIDNSFDAGASNIEIKLQGQPTNLESYLICDDGRGMDIPTLKNSLTYSAGSIHDAGDLGKFSIGGTTACCTLGLSRKVYTKTKAGPLLIATQDFENVEGGSTVRKPTAEEREWFQAQVGEQGTVVEISQLRDDKKEYSRIGDLKNALLKDFGQTFYQMLSGRRSLKITAGGKSYFVKPKDPLFWKTHPDFVSSHNEYSIPFQGSLITVRTSNLNLDAIDNDQKSYANQGIYFSRNNRLIAAGLSVKNLWTKNPRKNSGRVEISFTEELDPHFGLTATKNKVNLSQSVTDVLSKVIKSFISGLEEKWKKNKEVDSKEIQKENEDFKKKLVRNTGIVDLPRTEKSGGDNPIPRKKGDKKGTIAKKDTGIKRTGRGVKCPEFLLEKHDRSYEAFWTDFSNDEMKIVLNTSHSFVREHWVDGTEESRMLMRKWATAVCLAEFRKKETYHESAAKSFMMDMMHELSRLQMVFGS